jgi:putative membrane protein (TIGR04086 family)
VYKFDFDDAKVKVGVIIIYIVSCFLGGFILGKLKRSNKFLWGAACGATYFTILMLVSFVVNHGIGNSGVGVFTILTMCVASGMIGGMVS